MTHADLEKLDGATFYRGITLSPTEWEAIQDLTRRRQTMERPGIKTTEFWLALTVALLGGLAGLYAEHEWAKVAGLLAAALTSMGYGASRARAKSDQG